LQSTQYDLSELFRGAVLQREHFRKSTLPRTRAADAALRCWWQSTQ
jgi:hypothetical protein